MGKIIAFPIERAQLRETAPPERTRSWPALDTAAAALGASLAIVHAYAHAWCSVGRGIGQALEASGEPAGPAPGLRR
ncbi:MAG TPA: hypothetical protein PL143_07650 [Rhodocyclaceae bacterium]|nr:hypothetical protein [Rhodocyclaceae bacterium]